MDAEEFIPAGDELLVLVRWRATSHTGIEVDQRVAFRFLIRDERVTRFISYWGRADAFEALGLPRSRLTADRALPLHAERP